MQKKHISALVWPLFLIAVFLVVFLVVLHTHDSSSNADAIEYYDFVFNHGEVTIPLEVKSHPDSERQVSWFRIRKDIKEVTEDLDNLSSPEIIVREQKETYAILTVVINEKQESNVVLYYNGEKDGWCFYALKALEKDIFIGDYNKGYFCWPLHYFPRSRANSVAYGDENILLSGQEYETEATIEDFELFYRQIGEQYGIAFERSGNTLVLPPDFAWAKNGTITTTLTFSEGKVRVDFEENLEIVS